MKKIYFLISTLLIVAAIYSCDQLRANTKVEDAAFEYREIYLPLTSKSDFQDYELNNLDVDWGIWGHNMSNVVPDDASITIYAKVNGNTEEDQYCFSSNKLFEYYCNYIDDNFGRHDSLRFAVIPNDNVIACLCEKCVAAGNTKGNATPAVANFVEKLAHKYPNHTFFTSHYLTTEKLPSRKLPANTGVMISAMQYPLAAGATNGEEKFKNILNSWQGKTDKLYIWDYISNFDDYFTPFPVFNVMQRRLKTYRDAGVHGIFLNGSGTDYSTFARLKKAVLSQLLINPDQDWKELLQKYSSEYYPVAGKDIADFIIRQEEMVAAHGKALPMYDGVETARKLYLPEREFVDFYNKIQSHKKVATGWEKQDLETMAEALSLTLMELKRINGKKDDDGHLVRRLKRLAPKGIEIYNEGCWTIRHYLENYEFMEAHAKEVEGKNLLKGVTLQARTPLDEDYSDITIVTNGMLGIPSNYHSGNLISSADPALDIAVPRVEGMKKVKVWLSYNPGFKIGLPQEIWLMSGGQKIASQVPPRPKGDTGHAMVEFDVPAQGDIVLSFRKNPDVKTFAVEEVEGFSE